MRIGLSGTKNHYMDKFLRALEVNKVNSDVKYYFRISEVELEDLLYNKSDYVLYNTPLDRYVKLKKKGEELSDGYLNELISQINKLDCLFILRSDLMHDLSEALDRGYRGSLIELGARNMEEAPIIYNFIHTYRHRITIPIILFPTSFVSKFWKSQLEFKRIGISGAQRSGKTTLSNQISKEIGLPFLPTNCMNTYKEHGVLPIEELPKTFRRDIQTRMANYYSEITSKAVDGLYITDRTGLDFLAYIDYYDLVGGGDEYYWYSDILKKSLDGLNNLDVLILLHSNIDGAAAKHGVDCSKSTISAVDSMMSEQIFQLFKSIKSSVIIMPYLKAHNVTEYTFRYKTLKGIFELFDYYL